MWEELCWRLATSCHLKCQNTVCDLHISITHQKLSFLLCKAFLLFFKFNETSFLLCSWSWDHAYCCLCGSLSGKQGNMKVRRYGNMRVFAMCLLLALWATCAIGAVICHGQVLAPSERGSPLHISWQCWLVPMPKIVWNLFLDFGLAY